MIIIRYNNGVKIEEEELLQIIVINKLVNETIQAVNERLKKSLNNVNSSLNLVEIKSVS